MSNIAPIEPLGPSLTDEPVGPLALPSSRRGRRFGLPGWARLLLGNRKSCTGIIVFAGIVAAALAAPVLAQNSPTDLVGLPGQPPNRDFWFGTTDQGYDVFSQVVWGARTSLTVAACAAIASTVIATTLGLLAAYKGGWVDDVINLFTNIFLVIPTLPLLIVISAFVPTRGPVIMVLILGFTTWAIEARILRSQALSIVKRDFVLAAKVAGEGTWGIIWREVMPNMVSRIAAGFVFVFYGSIIFAAGLEFLGPDYGGGRLDRRIEKVGAEPDGFGARLHGWCVRSSRAGRLGRRRLQSVRHTAQSHGHPQDASAGYFRLSSGISGLPVTRSNI